MAINFFSSKDSEETCTMYSKSDNIDLFDSVLQRYKKKLEESMRGSEFFFIVLIHCIVNFIK